WKNSSPVKYCASFSPTMPTGARALRRCGALGSRGLDIAQFLLNIVRDVGKPQPFVGERDHQGTLGAADEIDVGASLAALEQRRSQLHDLHHRRHTGWSL